MMFINWGAVASPEKLSYCVFRLAYAVLASLLPSHSGWRLVVAATVLPQWKQPKYLAGCSRGLVRLAKWALVGALLVLGCCLLLSEAASLASPGDRLGRRGDQIT